ncbi:TIGR04283 family arsenosugar biosynthesis glycosyltransferase [Pyruvatibacter sp.]|uniref:TIGR04283 family arsenosugar biosynthesis glycosyltransferase n=1 Tax=Pyruvatibacter sp. TaxID=1981328 RepID=UPI0032EC5026
MLSVVIPTLNAEKSLTRTLAALVRPTVRGLIKDVVIADGGSTDETRAIAEAAGARFVQAPRGRGTQLAAGAQAARGDWLLFLHADTVLQPGWDEEVETLLDRLQKRGAKGLDFAAVFRFALDDFSFWARMLERTVVWRCWLFGLPYGDQGLLVSRRRYDALGGYRPLQIMEDVDMVRRIGRRRLVFLRTPAVTSPERYLNDGYIARSSRNALCLMLYYLGVNPDRIARIYKKR